MLREFDPAARAVFGEDLAGREAMAVLALAPSPEARIEDLPTEFTAVATDLEAGEERWLQGGPVDAAIRASVALPGFMTPVMVHGRLLADGGLLDPLPIAPTIGARADLTVAVAVSGQHRTSAAPTAAAARPGRGHRGDVARRTATHVIDSDVIHGTRTRVAAMRSAPPGRTTSEIAEEVAEAAFDALPAGLRMLDVMALSLEAVRTAVLRHTLAEHPPDVLIMVPGRPAGLSTSTRPRN
jgi:NTE family protein